MNLKNLRPRTGLAAAAVAAGLAVGAAGVAGAATSGGSTSAASTVAAATTQSPATTGTTPQQQVDPSTLTNGPGETLLTGATADSVTAAAKKAVPGATIIRVETDAQGAAYEAHMRKSDGTYVTVTFDKDFTVVSTDSGFGGGPGGHGPQGGQSPQGGYTP